MTESACPHCGEPVDPRQLVCLECGGRVALAESRPPARERLTAIAAALVVAIVIGAGLFGFAVSELTSGDGESEPQRTAAAAAPAREPPAVLSGEEQDAPASPRRSRGVPRWPRDLSAHTVVLVTSSDRAAALAVAREARSRGLEAGLMPSDPYDLGTGLWIVYSGRFTTPEGAQSQAAQLAERYPGAYPQLVQRSQ